MKLRFSIIGLALLVISGINLYATKKKAMSIRRYHQHQFFIDLLHLKRIGVSDNRIEKIKLIMNDIRENGAKNLHLIRQKNVLIRNEFLKKKLDHDRIINLIKEVIELKRNQLYFIQMKKYQIMKQLSYEQRSQLYKSIVQKRKRFWIRMRTMFRKRRKPVYPASEKRR